MDFWRRLSVLSTVFFNSSFNVFFFSISVSCTCSTVAIVRVGGSAADHAPIFAARSPWISSTQPAVWTAGLLTVLLRHSSPPEASHDRRTSAAPLPLRVVYTSALVRSVWLLLLIGWLRHCNCAALTELQVCDQIAPLLHYAKKESMTQQFLCHAWCDYKSRLKSTVWLKQDCATESEKGTNIVQLKRQWTNSDPHSQSTNTSIRSCGTGAQHCARKQREDKHKNRGGTSSNRFFKGWCFVVMSFFCNFSIEFSQIGFMLSICFINFSFSKKFFFVSRVFSMFFFFWKKEFCYKRFALATGFLFHMALFFHCFCSRFFFPSRFFSAFVFPKFSVGFFQQFLFSTKFFLSIFLFKKKIFTQAF